MHAQLNDFLAFLRRHRGAKEKPTWRFPCLIASVPAIILIRIFKQRQSMIQGILYGRRFREIL